MAAYDQLTLKELKAEVSDAAGWGTNPTVAQKAKIVKYLNAAQKIVCRRHNWTALERTDSTLITTQDKYVYHLPPYMKRILDARLIDDDCVLLDGCQEDWTLGTAEEITYDSTYRRVGTHSLKIDINASDNGVVAYSETKLGTVTALADASNFQTTVTSAAHGLSNGDYITIDGTTSYDGYYQITSVATNTFVVDKTFVADDATGTWYKGSLAGGDLSGYTNAMMGCWVYSTAALTAGDLAITVTEDAAGAETTNYITVAMPAVEAVKWTYLQWYGLNFASIDALLTVGIKNTDAALVADVYIDNITLCKQDFGGNNWPLRVIDRNVLDRSIPNPRHITNNRPTVLAVSGCVCEHRTVELFPVPDASYPIWIRYSTWPREFTTSNASVGCDIPDIDDVLIAGATWIALERERNWESAGYNQGTFRRLLAEAVSNDEELDGWQAVRQGFGSAQVAFGETIEIPTSTQSGVRGTTSGFFYF